MNFPGENQGGFSHSPVIYRIFCVKNLPETFFQSQRAMRFCNVKPVFSKTWSEAFIQRHCQTLMLRISFGLTLFSTLEAKLHGMAALLSLHIASTPPVWIRTHLFWIFFDAKYSCGVVASFVSPTKFCTQRLVAMSSICDQKNFVGGCLFHTIQCLTC